MYVGKLTIYEMERVMIFNQTESLSIIFSAISCWENGTGVRGFKY